MLVHGTVGSSSANVSGSHRSKMERVTERDTWCLEATAKRKTIVPVHSAQENANMTHSFWTIDMSMISIRERMHDEEQVVRRW